MSTQRVSLLSQHCRSTDLCLIQFIEHMHVGELSYTTVPVGTSQLNKLNTSSTYFAQGGYLCCTSVSQNWLGHSFCSDFLRSIITVIIDPMTLLKGLLWGSVKQQTKHSGVHHPWTHWPIIFSHGGHISHTLPKAPRLTSIVKDLPLLKYYITPMRNVSISRTKCLPVWEWTLRMERQTYSESCPLCHLSFIWNTVLDPCCM